MTKNCYDEDYVPVQMLNTLLSDSQDDREVKNCEKLCTCKQFDLAWFAVVNDIILRIDNFINNFKEMSDEDKKKTAIDNLNNIKDNSSPFLISEILQKVIDVGKKRWNPQDSDTNINSFFKNISNVKELEIVKNFDNISKGGEKVNSDIERKKDKNLDFSKLINFLNKMKIIFSLIKHLGNSKGNFENSIKEEVDEYVKEFIEFDKSLQGSKGGSKKKTRKFKRNKKLFYKKSKTIKQKGGFIFFIIALGVAIVTGICKGISAISGSNSNSSKSISQFYYLVLEKESVTDKWKISGLLTENFDKDYRRDFPQYKNLSNEIEAMKNAEFDYESIKNTLLKLTKVWKKGQNTEEFWENVWQNHDFNDIYNPPPDIYFKTILEWYNKCLNDNKIKKKLEKNKDKLKIGIPFREKGDKSVYDKNIPLKTTF